MLKGQVKALIGFACASAALLFAPSQAGAQDRADPFAFAGTTWQLGGFVFVTPKFEGAKSYEALGFPFIAPAGFGQGGSAIDIRGADDIRFRLIQNNGFEAEPLAGWRFGRDQDDAARLAGLGDIDGGLVVGAYAGYRVGPWFLSASYHHQVTGDDDTGGLVRLAIDHTWRLTPTAKLVTSIGTAYASSDYMQTYFGVTAAQSAASVAGLPQFDPSAGFKDVSVGATATIELDPRWTLYLTGRYSRLIGDAADSPVIETENGFFGGAGLSYKFDLVR
ncbi:MAG TPA: MipA/OmpV family protein [Hyphomicrobiaceae bacterium]|nr:MipA/OmpV family protein [Hyphomicrobiaceae bacterium]